MNASDIIIKLIGGPRDGDEKILMKPYTPVLRFRSNVNKRIHVYQFDDDKKNVNEPFAFKYAGIE